MNKGSIWRKWNFHVHTKGTNKSDLFTSTSMDEFFKVFYKKAFENEISAIGITDYFSIDRYNDAIKYREEIGAKLNPEGNKLFTNKEIEFIKNIFIFPNVELRMMPSTDKGSLINIHCLFNPDYVSELENDFFSSIENQAGIKMNRHGMIKYGKRLHPEIHEEDVLYRKGLEKFAIDLKDLNKLISSNKQFKNNTIIVVSNSSNDGASAIRQHYHLFENETGSVDGVRQSIYEISDAIFSARPKDIKYFLGKRLEGTEGYNEEVYKKEVEEVISQRGSLKPCIVGCDAHKEADLFTRFTWIKADLNFEGLRQICFEPELRVKIQDTKPDYKEERLLIEKVQFISPNEVFSTNPIFLNPNLNVIIGGKSSGKSIFLYSIAKTLSADVDILKNDGGNFKYNLNKIEEGFDFEITTKGGHTQKYSRDDDENSILPEIKYIPQNYLVKLAEPELNKKGESLNDLVRSLITEDDESKEFYNEFLLKVKRNDALRNSKIDSYFELLNSIKDLERELKTKSQKGVLQANIKTNSNKVFELNSSTGLTQEQLSKYQLLREKIEINNIKLGRLKNDLSNIKSFNSDFVQTLKNLKQRKDTLLNNIQTEEIKNLYEKEYENIDFLLNKSLEIDKTTQTETKEGNTFTFKSKSKFSDIYDALKKEEENLNQQIQPYLKDEQVKEKIELLNQSIKKDKKALIDIDELNEKLERSRLSLETSKSDLFKIFRDNYNEYIKAINALKNRTIELEKDGLKIEGKVCFNFPKLRKRLIEISDSRTASYSGYSILQENKKSTDEANLDAIIEELKTLFDEIINGQYVFLKYQQPSTCIKLIMNDYFFDNWEIEYKNDILGEMSTGKASFVILMLMIGLSKSKAPILIDQPEDNLDNRSITTDLVSYLRNKKIERQIIVVTHNPNVVVNADAENVIVANQKGQNDSHSSSPFKFDYINGAIENSSKKDTDEKDLLKSMGIRQHIADVVEGGKEAFLMRERKYRFD